MSVRDIKTWLKLAGLKLADCWPGYPWFKSHVRGYGYNHSMVFELTIKPKQNNCKKSTIRPAVALGADWVFENPGVGYWTIIFVWYNGTKSSKEWVRALGTATRWSRVATDCNWLQLITTDWLLIRRFTQGKTYKLGIQKIMSILIHILLHWNFFQITKMDQKSNYMTSIKRISAHKSLPIVSRLKWRFSERGKETSLKFYYWSFWNIWWNNLDSFGWYNDWIRDGVGR